jgi:hypothetical protein
MPKTPDGTLQDWGDIAGDYAWETLLLGNGLSINVWEEFKYRRLYDHAKSGGLTAADRELFASTPNFERVLGDLLTAIRVNEIVGIDSGPAYERYRNIQTALGHAIREVHVQRYRVPGKTHAAIRDVLEGFEWIFTTSYDLLLYWVIGYQGKFAPFIDHFRYGGRCEFDPKRAGVYEDQIPIYFLHGALHLVVGGSGVTWKLRRNDVDALLDQFGQPISGDPRARPLLVTEGSTEDKLEVIEGNEYLSHAIERLRSNGLATVVFGSGLSTHDAHLAEALNEFPERPVAVSMLPGRKSDLLARQVDIYGKLEAETLLFFDATTHPLGDPALRATQP